MKRLIHLFMGVGRDAARQAETEPGFEHKLEAAVQTLEIELGTALEEFARCVSERNRVRAESERWFKDAQRARESARRLIETDESQARAELSRWATLQQAAEELAPELERLDRACTQAGSRVSDLRTRLEESRRNAHTLMARRSAARAQQRLAEAIAAARDEELSAPTIKPCPSKASAIDLEREFQRLRDETKR